VSLPSPRGSLPHGAFVQSRTAEPSLRAQGWPRRAARPLLVLTAAPRGASP